MFTLELDPRLPDEEVPVDLDLWRELTTDTEVWGLSDVTRELGLNRTTAHRLRVALRNLTEGRIAVWPPRGPELEKLQPVLGTTPEPWWPDCVSALPPVDFPGTSSAPRWYAGTIRRWAMRVGRMAPDGTLITPANPGTRPRPSEPMVVDDLDLGRVQELWADTTLWKVRDIAVALDVEPHQAENWARVASNYTAQGMKHWPPAAGATVIAKVRSGPRLQDWPPHWRTLPPPDETVTVELARGKAGQRQYARVAPRWYAGTIRRWAMRVGRMAPDGTATPLGKGWM